jgi:hypothetical protein
MNVNGYVEMISELGFSPWERIAEFKYYDEATRYAVACASADDAGAYSYRACKTDGTVIWNSSLSRETITA